MVRLFDVVVTFLTFCPMKLYKTEDIRNISVIGSSGAGKTTLAEAMLFESGVIKRRGDVESKNTVCDYFPVEKEYGYTVFSTVFSVEWKERKLNFIDCPGADDFMGATVGAMNITDCSLAVINAQYGVEVGLINQFRYISKLNKPAMFIVNQLDADKADFDLCIAQLHERYGGRVVVVQYPVVTGSSFNQVIDLLNMRMYQWGPDGGKPEILPIPEKEMEKAEELRQKLIESAAEHEDTLMERFFEKGSLDEAEIVEGMRKGIVKGDMYPVFCVSALKDMCVRRTMEFLGDVAPRVTEMPNPTTIKGEEVVPNSGGPLSVFFFKTTVEPHIGEVSYFKVMSGTLKEGEDLLNVNNGSKERLSQICVVAGQTKEKITQLEAGDIGAVVKLKEVRLGHTLNVKDVELQFPPIEYPAPKYRQAVRAVNQADTEKMSEVLHRMSEEDPTWIIEHSKELRQIIVYGQGEFHLRTLKWRIENNDKIQIEYYAPKIPYRETITSVARADYRHKKQSGGAGQFGEVHLIVEPYEDSKPLPDSYKINGQEFRVTARDVQEFSLEWGGKLVFVNSVVGGAIDTRFMPAIIKGIMARMEQGPLTGSYARDVRVVVYDGKMHPVDSNEISFMLAGRNAFSEAFRNANPKILEPVYDVEVSVPSEYMGDVMSDLQNRRGMIMGMSSKKGYELLQSKVPLKELSNYSTVLSSITGGRASFVMTFASYELVPMDIQEKLLKEYAQKEDADV